MRRRRKHQLAAALTALGVDARVSGGAVLAWLPGDEPAVVVVRPQWWPGDRVGAAGKRWRRWPPRRVWVYDPWRIPAGQQPRADVRRTASGVAVLLGRMRDRAGRP